MTEDAKIAAGKKNRALALYCIAGFKLLKGVLLLLAAAGIFALSRRDLPTAFDGFLRWVHIDPENRFFAGIGDRLTTITPANVKTVASGTLIYGLFLCMSGLGLALRWNWAIWLAIGEAAFFIPIELFELVRPHTPDGEARAHAIFPHPEIGMAIILIVNVLIVWYLYKNRERLFRHHS